ncbi:folylpolyglutamate synthase/dihydrofolate synthase family protein [Stakelama sediminis]|uniref:Dihydrofolate synthase/folylpolyglutamate synthase n=1 Tax=Stakelama sediminis TaxID=463200 RepID=A0A840YUM7_9SPHN|nr:folylpolyglutamate synthase/dihydrofolate synthase family protein [Stakelama sediminis]MBB5717277.1 dihydrofolate synthase/folylpolyglutamate synthase [Stakelama sediminis]
MPDFAVSADPAVQKQLDRLFAHGPGADVLGLDRITRLLDRLGNPQAMLPPVFHVAGTNGKGSTCAFLRAALEADGKRVHVFTSPHLVRFNERIRLAGKLIDDAALAVLLDEVLTRGDGIGASFFEVTSAAAFLAFSRIPADACVIEVGLGGRLDATNALSDPAVCGIAQLGIDHQAFLGDSLPQIAREKAGIAKAGRPLVTLSYPDAVKQAIAETAATRGALLHMRGTAWNAHLTDDGIRIEDAQGTLILPLPALPGAHQATNLSLAAAMLRAQDRVTVSDKALMTAAVAARWPARMQPMAPGPLRGLLPQATELWLDGGHNAAAAQAVHDTLATRAAGRPVHLVLGMLANKDARGLLEPLAPLAASLHAVPVPGHACHPPAMLAALGGELGIATTATATDPAVALKEIADTLSDEAIVLILGSLYLAGEALAANDEFPD